MYKGGEATCLWYTLVPISHSIIEQLKLSMYLFAYTLRVVFHEVVLRPPDLPTGLFHVHQHQRTIIQTEIYSLRLRVDICVGYL